MIKPFENVEGKKKELNVLIAESLENFIDNKLVEQAGSPCIVVRVKYMNRTDLYEVMDQVIEKYREAGWFVVWDKFFSFINQDEIYFGSEKEPFYSQYDVILINKRLEGELFRRAFGFPK